MIKRLIFDLDNTLIIFRDGYKNAFRIAMQKSNLQINSLLVDEVINKYGNMIQEYERHYSCYSKDNMLEFLCNTLKLNLDISFVENWLNELKQMADVDKDVIDILDYLSQKYELVILTNWFKETQLARLQKVGIDKYFEEVYAGDIFIKPYAESFKMAMGDRNVNECVMIGDSYKIDIEGATKVGMNAIMITDKDIQSTNTYKVIHDIKMLKEMF